MNDGLLVQLLVTYVLMWIMFSLLVTAALVMPTVEYLSWLWLIDHAGL